MADYSAAFVYPVWQAEANFRGSITDIDYNPASMLLCDHVEEDLPVLQSKSHESALLDAFPARLVLDGKLYIFPRLFEDGLLAEEKTHQITVWNAGKAARTITGVVGATTDGTSLDHPTLPQVVTPETNKTHTITVNQTGPAVQYTTYTYNVDGGMTAIVLITGQRIRIFAYQPDWSSGIKHKYQFQTVLSRSDRFAEQRRALFETPRLTQEAAFWFDDGRLQKLINDLRLFKGVLVGAPIYSEPLTPLTDPLLGESTIVFSEDFTDYWHLASADMVVFFDTERPEIAEIKEIDALDTPNRQISFDNAVINDFDSDTVIAYPVMISASPVPKFASKTDRLGQVSLVFEEIER